MPRLVLSLHFAIAALYGFCPFYAQSSFTIGVSPSMVLCCLQRAFCNFVSKIQIDNSSKQYHIEKPSFCSNLGDHEHGFYACSGAVLSAMQFHRRWETAEIMKLLLCFESEFFFSEAVPLIIQILLLLLLFPFEYLNREMINVTEEE